MGVWMVQYAQIECFDCHGIFQGNMMRRKSLTKASGRHTRDYNPFDQDDMKQALSSSVTTYSTSEVLLCPSCRSKRRFVSLFKFLFALLVIGAAAYFVTQHFSAASVTSDVEISSSQPNTPVASTEDSKVAPKASLPAEFDFNSPTQRINEGNCHMGECGWTTTLSLETIEERNGTQLKKMRFVYGSTPDDGSSKKKRILWNDDISEVYVLCSKRLPAVLLEQDGSIQTDVLDFTEISGASAGAAALYVEACHGLNNLAYMSDSFVKRYGYNAGGPYSPSADDMQMIEISKPEEIFEYDK
jgi:hypothetical protein